MKSEFVESNDVEEVKDASSTTTATTTTPEPTNAPKKEEMKVRADQEKGRSGKLEEMGAKEKEMYRGKRRTVYIKMNLCSPTLLQLLPLMCP